REAGKAPADNQHLVFRHDYLNLLTGSGTETNLERDLDVIPACPESSLPNDAVTPRFPPASNMRGQAQRQAGMTSKISENTDVQ
ncbi:MAG: hypothetical protein ACM32I_08870, partial [Nitrospirota bacterium]